MVMHFGSLAHELASEPAIIFSSDEACLRLAAETEDAARYVARHLHERPIRCPAERSRLTSRDEILEEISQEGVKIWTRLGTFWSALAEHFACESDEIATYDSRIAVAVALAKLERNLVAGMQAHQELAVQHEPQIRQLIFQTTTFARIEDTKYFTLHGLLTQLLSNIISPASQTLNADRLADEYLRLYTDGQRENDMIIRLLDSLDSKTNTATLHLIGNVTRNSRSRLLALLSPAGVRWLSKVLGRMDDWLEGQDGRFELACSIFDELIDHGLQSRLFAQLCVANEPISPSQTIFLKILDSYLSRPDSSPHAQLPGQEDSTGKEDAGCKSPNHFLVPVFQLLAAYALTSLARAQDDPRLPKVFEALVLVCEGLSSIGLAVQRVRDKAGGEAGSSRTLTRSTLPSSPAAETADAALVAALKSRDDAEGIIEPLIAPAPIPPDQARPIAQLKRNLVQLLGILCFDDVDVRSQVREARGVQLLLSMTEVDEDNPYLREHALFAVRNLLLNDPANQAIISQMDPVGVLSESGELLPVPERMRGPNGR